MKKTTSIINNLDLEIICQENYYNYFYNCQKELEIKMKKDIKKIYINKKKIWKS